MDDKELEQQKNQEAGKNTAHTLGKGLATYYGGNVGNELYNAASNTEVGRRIEQAVGNGIQQNPALNKASRALNDSGALDAANRGIDAATGSKSEINVENSDTNNNDTNKKNSSGLGSLFGGLRNKSTESSSTSSGDSEDNSTISFSSLVPGGKGMKRMIVISSIAAFSLIVLIYILIYVIVIGPAETVIKFFSGMWNSIVDFFTVDQQELEQKYYNKLQEVQERMNKDYNICIDVNLITASLTVDRDFEDFLNDETCTRNCDTDNDGKCDMNCDNNNDGVCDENCDYEGDLDDGTCINHCDEDDSECFEKCATKSEVNTDRPYNKMTKQVELLARMQMTSKYYSLDENHYKETGTYCKETESIVSVTTENISGFNYSLYKWLTSGKPLDSSTPEQISKNDMGDFKAFFNRKAKEEINAAYYFYYPAFDENNGCSNKYAKKLLPEKELSTSIGDYTTAENYVYYWNLVNSFIPNYYKDYLPEDENERYKKIIEIADNIFLLYDEMGPSQTCAQPYTGPSTLCPNGVTVANGDETAVFELEEYVAGVVSKEAYTSEGMEALKAQAVAARTYVLNYTNHCSKSIPNGTNAQTFTRNINDNARQAAIATAGEILTYNGNIFSSQYDSYCYDDNDCPDSKKNSDGTYSVTYTKVPNGERHTITLSDSKQYGRITHGQGHAHGMSQLLSYQLAKEGKTYKEILGYFYSPGVEVSIVLTPTGTGNSSIINKSIQQILSESGSSIENMNEYIYSNVLTAGLSTRAGVVAAATSLITGINSQTGYILPYELVGDSQGGKYPRYGIDPNWGTNTGNSKYPRNGLDCSGFISWAIHNGGYQHVIKNAKGWGNSGTKRSWSKGTEDSSAQPGDLIYNAPTSDNGTSGHIRMIIGVKNDGYVIAEASSGKNGVRIVDIPFKSTGNYYLVDMSNYYQTATKVTDYPK